jgi:hypothetical protein
MAYHFGKLGYLAIQVQSAEGTADLFEDGLAPKTVGIGMPITEQPGLKPVIEKEFKNYYKKSSSEYSDYTVKRLAAEGDISVPAFPEGPLEALLYGVFGDVSSTLITDTTTAYANVFVMDDTLPIFSAAVGRDALAYQEFYDLRMGKMDIDMKPGEDISLSVSTTGKGGAIDNAAFTPVYPDTRSFAFDDVGVSLGGSPNCDVTEMSLSIDRGIKSLRSACAAAAKGDNVIYPTTINVEGSMTLMFQDYTEYKYWLGGAAVTEPTFNQTADDTKRALTITMTGEPIGDGAPADNAAFVLTLPRIVYDTAEIDMPFDDRMMVKFDFKALHDPTSETALAGTGTIKAQVDSDYDAESLLV